MKSAFAQMHFTPHGVLVLVMVLLTFGAALWALVVMLLAWMLLHPPRMSAGRAIYHLRRLSPGDLGLPFEEQPFTIRDARTGRKMFIAGWWIPTAAPSERCALLLHGYADAKVGAIAWAPLLHDLDLNILAIDLRAHGNSDGSYSTGGFFERDDVNQVLDQLLNLFPSQTREIILFGASLGAAVATGVAALRSEIASVILESPFTDYEKAVTAHVRSLGLPAGLTTRAALVLAHWICGADFKQVRPVDLITKIRCPILMIVGLEDELLDQEDLAALEHLAEAHHHCALWLVEGAGHLQAMANDPNAYADRIAHFLAGNSSYP